MAFLKRIKGMTTGLFKKTEAASKDIEQAGETLKQINEMKEEFLEELGQMEKEVQDTETDESSEDLAEALDVIEKEFEEVLEDEIKEDPLTNLSLGETISIEESNYDYFKDLRYDSLKDLYYGVEARVEEIIKELIEAGEHTVTIQIDFDDKDVDDLQVIEVPPSEVATIVRKAVRDNKTFTLRLISEKDHRRELVKLTKLGTSALAKDKEEENETKDERPIHDEPGRQDHSNPGDSDSISQGQFTEETLERFGFRGEITTGGDASIISCVGYDEETLERFGLNNITRGEAPEIGIDWGSDEDEENEGCDDEGYDDEGYDEDGYDEDGYDEDEENEDEERQALNEEMGEFLKSTVEKALEKPLIPANLLYFNSVDDEDNLYEKYNVSQSGHEITMEQGGERQPFSFDVIISFLEDESDYFSRDDSIMVLSESHYGIDHVASLGETEDLYENLEVHSIITENGDLRAAGRISGGAYKYVFDRDGWLNRWVTDYFKESKEQDDFYIYLAYAMQERIEEEIPKLDEHYFQEMESYGRPMQRFLKRASEIEAAQIKANQRKADEKITVGSDMSEKNIDVINKAEIYPEISGGKRMFIESKTRYNKFIAYIDENEPRTPRGGLKISFGEELEEDSYDDFQIKIEKLFPRQETVTIKDTQVIKDLTEYLQLTDEEEFVIELMTFINRQSDMILSGVRQQLILVPDMVKRNVILAYSDVRGNTALRNLSVKDIKNIAGGEYGMSAYIDLDMLGGYIYGKR